MNTQEQSRIIEAHMKLLDAMHAFTSERGDQTTMFWLAVLHRLQSRIIEYELSGGESEAT